jgi:hypothetical protein
LLGVAVYIYLIAADPVPAPKDASLLSWKLLFIQFVPRTIFLVFVELTAGYFLREYRLSLEEYRYFAAVERVRQAQLVSYLVRRKDGDKRVLVDFTNKILAPLEVGLLRRGETTSMLRAQELAHNDVAELAKGLLEELARTTDRQRKKPRTKARAASDDD